MGAPGDEDEEEEEEEEAEMNEEGNKGECDDKNNEDIGVEEKSSKAVQDREAGQQRWKRLGLSKNGSLVFPRKMGPGSAP